MYVDLVAQDCVYGDRVDAFHVAVQRAPAGVGSSAGGAEASAGPEDAGSAADAELLDSVVAKAVAARSGRIAKSFIVGVVGAM